MHFESYQKIEQIGRLYMTITQKIHGSNAQILIESVAHEWQPAECGYQDYNVIAGSRTRWLTPDDDNYGFAQWVMDNRYELIEKLGVGRHYGEWCGKGINAGEGLIEKHFVLFNWHKFRTMPLPSRVMTVPLLYSGKFSFNAINEVMEDLKQTGSKLVPGYMKPEGIVIQIDEQKYKKVFDDESVAWKKPEVLRINRVYVDVSHLLQPLRLEKLIGRDEANKRNYPDNIRDIFKMNYQDLIDEKQVDESAADIDDIKKALGKQLYSFIKEYMEIL